MGVMIGFIMSVQDFQEIIIKRVNMNFIANFVNRNKIMKLSRIELNKCLLNLIKFCSNHKNNYSIFFNN